MSAARKATSSKVKPPPPTTPAEQMLTVPQVAALLALHPETVRRLVVDGQLIAHDMRRYSSTKHRWRIEPTEVERFKRRNRF